MTWFKTTDTLMTDAKVMMMPLHERGMALGTWIACGTWSAQHLTDGKVPSGVVENFVGTLEGAETLVRAKMWKRTRGGYSFNNWAKYQFTREQVEDKREQERARKAEARERAKAKRQLKDGNVPGVSQWDADGTEAVSDIPDPSRPVPTRPVPSLPIGESLGGGSPKRRARFAPQECGREHDPADPCGACGAARRRQKDAERAEADRIKAEAKAKAERNREIERAEREARKAEEAATLAEIEAWKRANR